MEEPELGTGVMSDHRVCLGSWRENGEKSRKVKCLDVLAIGPLDDLGASCLSMLVYLPQKWQYFYL